MTADGSALLAVTDQGRLWRVGLDGAVAPLTPELRDSSDPREVLQAAPAADGSILVVHGTRIGRLAPDGRETTIAGTGREGDARPGPALRSPLEFPRGIAATPAGGFVFSASGALWQVDAGGTLSRVAGGGDHAPPRDLPASGARADRYFLEVATIAGDPAGELVLSSNAGVHTLRGGILREVVDAAEEQTEPLAPLWSGGLAAKAWIDRPGAAVRTPDGGWLVGTNDGVALLTDAQGRAQRLAVAIETATLATAADGAVRIAATRPASVRLRASAAGRRVAEITTVVQAGTNVVRLPQLLPPGVVQLSVRATAEDGAIARHSLAVLGSREVPLDVARRALYDFSDTSRELTSMRGCRRERATRVTCVMRIIDQDEGTTSTGRFAVTLRPDGWLWGSGPHFGASRIELVAPRR